MPDIPEEEFRVLIRPGKPSDVHYVAQCWLRGIQRGSYAGMRVSREVFMAHEPARIASTLQKAAVFVAHPEGDEDTILAFIVLEELAGKPLIHWIYTRESWRKVGIAKQLIQSLGIDPNECQFPTWAFDANWITRKYPRAVFNPYLGVR